MIFEAPSVDVHNNISTCVAILQKTEIRNYYIVKSYILYQLISMYCTAHIIDKVIFALSSLSCVNNYDAKMYNKFRYNRGNKSQQSNDRKIWLWAY